MGRRVGVRGLLANACQPISSRRERGVRGRIADVPEAYRDRTDNGQKRCLTSDLSCFSKPFRLVAEARGRDS